MPQKLNFIRGYTMMELVVVMALIGILAAIAVPSFALQIKQSRISSTANQLHSVFKFARSEAAKREVSVDLEVSGNRWLVNVDGEMLKFFEPKHSSITVPGLSDMVVADTGSTSIETFLITDNDASTDDYYLCIYLSGQSELLKGQTCL